MYEMYMSTSTTLVDYREDRSAITGGCDPDAYTIFSFSNVPYPPFTINGVTYPGGTLGLDLEYFFSANLTLVSEVQTPEPSTWMMIGTGLIGLSGAVRRRVLVSL